MSELFPFSSALFGGMLIGLSALLLMLAIGRISGISGIISQLISSKAIGKYWRLVFVVGILLGSYVYHLVIPHQLPFRTFENTALIIVAGVLVGFGTHLGSGCTSGHGVCGISRFSTRSIVATVIFMLFASLIVFIVRHIVVIG